MSAYADEEGIRGWKITGWNLQPAKAGFVCVAAVSTAGFLNKIESSTREGGFRLCRRGFNRRVSQRPSF